MKLLMVDSLVGNDYSIALCSGLSQQGVDVHLVVPQDRVIESDITFPVIYLAPSKSPGVGKMKKALQYVAYLLQLWRLIRRGDVQIVHFQFFRRERLDTFFLRVLKFLPVSTVYTAHNVLPHENSRIDYLLKYLVYKAADGIIVHSEHIRGKLLGSFKIDSAKICVIPHGNFDLYLPEEELSKKVARTRLGLAQEDKVLLFFGHIRAYKGLDLLIDAFEIASTHDQQLKLIIAGAPHSQQLAARYAAQVQKTPARERIIFDAHFIPFEEVATYFTAADLVVLPYKEIDHSGIVHLAYSFGKPIIGTSVGDFAEVIEQGKSGYVLQNHDTDCLAEAIQVAFSDVARLEEMGRFARQLSETKYSWMDIARNTKLFYETVIGRRTYHISELERGVTT